MSEGYTPLHMACINMRHGLVLELLAKGADVNAKSIHGMTALQYATIVNDPLIVEILLSRGAVKDGALQTCFDSFNVMSQADDVSSYDQKAFREEAAESDHYDVIKLLLDEGATVTDGLLFNAIDKKSLRLVELLLDHGVNPNQTCDMEGNRPLIVACMSGQHDLVELLLRRGANPNLLNLDNMNTLQALVFMEYNDMTILERICSVTRHIDNSDVRGNTALYFACDQQNYEIVKLLRKYGAEYDVQNEKGMTPLLIADKRKAVAIIELLTGM